MTGYTFRYLNAIGVQLAVSVVDCKTDAEAVRMAAKGMQAHYATLEVWRGELLYRGTGAGTPMQMALKYEGYRNKAEELRVIAEDYKAADTRRSLLRLADDYETMAERFHREAPP